MKYAKKFDCNTQIGISKVLYIHIFYFSINIVIYVRIVFQRAIKLFRFTGVEMIWKVYYELLNGLVNKVIYL